MGNAESTVSRCLNLLKVAGAAVNAIKRLTLCLLLGIPGTGFSLDPVKTPQAETPNGYDLNANLEDM